MNKDVILEVTAEILGAENDPRQWPENWQDDFVEDMQRKINFFQIWGFNRADSFLRALDSLIEEAHKIYGAEG